MARTDCPLCLGSGWKVVERTTKGAEVLPADSSGETKMVWAVPCDCTVGDRTDRILAKARVPERYRHCDFDNYEADNEIENVSREQSSAWNRSLSQAKLVVRRFAEEFSPVREVESEHGLLLMGPCGVGKTHLAVSALKQIVLRGYRGLFYDYRELLKAIQDSYNPESQTTEMSVLEPVLQAELLVLDDVGSSKPSLWALETVGHILNTRYNEKRVTLLTTNFLDADASEPTTARAVGVRPAAIDDSLTDRVGKRIRSRLYEMCRTVEIFAPDYRKEIRNISRFRT
ncbi:MAG TPA: ATP-binding protein [Candidatus Acidoferrum sp.]|nr:ATP-binding protein [Candidatus Acidoferrum sp.]